MEAVEAYRQVPIDGYYINTTEYRNIAKKYRAIYQIVYQNFHLNSIKEFQAITQEQAQQFDQIRKANMEDMMESASISDNMKAYWQKCFDKSPKALLYEYIDGYSYFTFIIFYSAISAGAAGACYRRKTFYYVCRLNDIDISAYRHKLCGSDDYLGRRRCER